MKKMFMLLTLFSIFSAHAATQASLDYSCEMNDQIYEGTVSIDDQFVNGESSCMYFGEGKPVCWRFERHVKINDIYLALRYADKLRSNLDENFIQLGNIPPAEGGIDEITVKMGLKKKLLRCAFVNVNWKK